MIGIGCANRAGVGSNRFDRAELQPRCDPPDISQNGGALLLGDRGDLAIGSDDDGAAIGRPRDDDIVAVAVLVVIVPGLVADYSVTRKAGPQLLVTRLVHDEPRGKLGAGGSG